MTAPGIRAVERLAAKQAKRTPVCCDNCGREVADTDAGVVVPGLGGKPLGLACRDCAPTRTRELGGPGIMLPHPSECCLRGVDTIDADRTYVVHDTGARRWGYTVIADGRGTVVDRWGDAP